MQTFEILTPVLPESVADATVVAWHKKAGDMVQRDEVLVEIETDKVVLEVPAIESGVLEQIVEPVGATVVSKQLLGVINASATAQPQEVETITTRIETESNNDMGPAVRRLLAEHDLSRNDIEGSGVNGRLTREDIEQHIAHQAPQTVEEVSVVEEMVFNADRSETRVPMTRLRKRIAERLLEVKSNTAMLTTFNEVDMLPIQTLRKKYGEKFEKQHGVRLGFMSFYVKAVVEALKRYPAINASIDGDDVVYHNYFDISIAVSTPRGLVTPVIRDCDKKSMAEIEKEIKAYAIKGQEGKLTVEDLTGGNFTITNGGVFGSLMSTPIINPPQSAILGMHAIKDRPIALNGEVVIRPMMYLALSYDHRLIDGKESVGFLVTIKELLEDPTRILLAV
ncbi:dihydrolipoamide succinyltransferase [Actinobacillus delphinicola]|uniref:Dihydrolipoyllysine-residue succinyltransferase component of 2-oxoglutarate dehydrogenase complex n=1 Tax=Actinobacillus delphinicola TaxID=51161 RepID=A0A448TVP3_9PAST|nr:2-oxoglutarate dehydrogenase complex dihydrolipoyllysine-residue succinyltransferase [Actinobacillus delphinicola]MDG6896522.1 dihydrolipoamide succinyltransferase [Actinobacillus delphinicola]VEJ10002.1 dihydrolipoamide succinyltransferase [Actinobacillus delphinicola]